MITPPDFERSSGVLLHVTSLPGPFGIGDLGPEAHRWVDWLAETGSRYWQMLPLGPTGFGDSPYSSFSSHAGNTDLISPEALVTEGFLSRDELAPVGDLESVDYRAVRTRKTRWLKLARGRLSGELADAYEGFRHAEADWVEPYALFMALKEAWGGGSWTSWSDRLRRRQAQALVEAASELSDQVDLHVFGQFLFYRQLDHLRSHAGERGVELIGDVPLYVAPDSVDVWLHPHLFTVESTGVPSHVAGVPPDMFSDTGQRWGNPLYRWPAHAEGGYVWWADRLAAFFRQADVLRIDHFTGLVTYYEIEASNPTAMGGVWHPGPGLPFFEAIEGRLGPLRVIVEDLGPAGQVVEELRCRLGYPGMEVIQEAFGTGEAIPPIDRDRVVYTGTHDNDTALGRFESETAAYREEALSFSGDDESSYPAGLIERAWESEAVMAVVPMQDLLGLGSEARMNYPGTTEGNWRWRMLPGAASPALADRLADLNLINKRSRTPKSE